MGESRKSYAQNEQKKRREIGKVAIENSFEIIYNIATGRCPAQKGRMI